MCKIPKQIIKKTAGLLIQSIQEIKTEEITISFSGGIDSSLLAFLIQQYCKQTKQIDLMYTGLEDQFDFFNSQHSAKLLQLPLKQRILTEQEICKYKNEISEIIQSDDLVEISYLLPFYAVLKNTKMRTVVTGQGSDELFMGYHKFLTNTSKAQQLSQKLYSNLWDLIPHRENKLAQECEKDLIMPFMNKSLETYVMKLDLNHKIQEEKNKILLRETARFLGLPEEIAIKKKKAAQYGSGIWKVLKKNNK